MIFYIYHTHFEFRAYINFEFHSSKDNRDIARNVAAFWVIQAIERITNPTNWHDPKVNTMQKSAYCSFAT